jgi:hypothetical protein
MMMHQKIEDKPVRKLDAKAARRVLILAIEEIISQMDLIQATLMMARLGHYDEEQFVIKSETPYQSSCYVSSLRGLTKDFHNISRPLTSIQAIFDGGPHENSQFHASVAAFVADRVLRCIRDDGRDKVCEVIEDVIRWKKNGTKLAEEYEEEKSDEWDDVAAAERYAG